MAILRWYPIRETASLQSRMNSLFEDISRIEETDSKKSGSTGFVPPVDVYEDEHQIVLKLEVPGVKPENLEVQLENNTLTIRGERKLEKEEKKENFQRVERRYGSFSRIFTLPTTVDSENVKAQYDSGVLKLELNKRAEAKPKQIKIGVGSSHAVTEDGTVGDGNAAA